MQNVRQFAPFTLVPSSPQTRLEDNARFHFQDSSAVGAGWPTHISNNHHRRPPQWAPKGFPPRSQGGPLNEGKVFIFTHSKKRSSPRFDDTAGFHFKFSLPLGLDGQHRVRRAPRRPGPIETLRPRHSVRPLKSQVSFFLRTGTGSKGRRHQEASSPTPLLIFPSLLFTD